jgi:hypothetical protein
MTRGRWVLGQHFFFEKKKQKTFDSLVMLSQLGNSIMRSAPSSA